MDVCCSYKVKISFSLMTKGAMELGAQCVLGKACERQLVGWLAVLGLTTL